MYLKGLTWCSSILCRPHWHLQDPTGHRIRCPICLSRTLLHDPVVGFCLWGRCHQQGEHCTAHILKIRGRKIYFSFFLRKWLKRREVNKAVANTLWIIGYHQAVWTINNYKEQKIAEFEQSHAQLLLYAHVFLPTSLQQLWSRSSWSLEHHAILPQKWLKCYFGIDLQNFIWKIYILSFSIFWLVKGVITLLFLTEYFDFSAIFDSSMDNVRL